MSSESTGDSQFGEFRTKQRRNTLPTIQHSHSCGNEIDIIFHNKTFSIIFTLNKLRSHTSESNSYDSFLLLTFPFFDTVEEPCIRCCLTTNSDAFRKWLLDLIPDELTKGDSNNLGSTMWSQWKQKVFSITEHTQSDTHTHTNTQKQTDRKRKNNQASAYECER